MLDMKTKFNPVMRAKREAKRPKQTKTIAQQMKCHIQAFRPSKKAKRIRGTFDVNPVLEVLAKVTKRRGYWKVAPKLLGLAVTRLENGNLARFEAKYQVIGNRG